MRLILGLAILAIILHYIPTKLDRCEASLEPNGVTWRGYRREHLRDVRCVYYGEKENPCKLYAKCRN